MSEKLFLTQGDVRAAAVEMAARIKKLDMPKRPHVYGIPRGGVPVAYLLAQAMEISIVENAADADILVDDLVDTGRTKKEFLDRFPKAKFEVLIDKVGSPKLADRWIVFPWEGKGQSDDDSIVGTITNQLRKKGIPFAANDCIAEFISSGERELLEIEVERRCEALLRALIINVDEDHNTKGTAKRLASMFIRETMRGRFYPAPRTTEFPNVKKLDELYCVGPLSVTSLCSHHLQPIIGRAWIGVIPGDKLIGLSKFARVLRWFASRPQIQEELIVQVANELERLTKPKGLAVVIEATHGCMTCRGVRESDEAKMINSVMRGAFRSKPEARSEFLSLIGKG